MTSEYAPYYGGSLVRQGIVPAGSRIKFEEYARFRQTVHFLLSFKVPQKGPVSGRHGTRREDTPLAMTTLFIYVEVRQNKTAKGIYVGTGGTIREHMEVSNRLPA